MRDVYLSSKSPVFTRTSFGAFALVFISLSVAFSLLLTNPVHADDPAPAPSSAPTLDELDPVAAQQVRDSFANPQSRAALLEQAAQIAAQADQANPEVVVQDRIDVIEDVGTIRVNAEVTLAPSLDPEQSGAVEVESVRTFGTPASSSQSLLARSGRIEPQRRGSVVVPSGAHGKLWVVTLEAIGIQAAIIGSMALLPSDVTKWGRPDFLQPFVNFTRGPRIDNDHWYWNYIGHPWGGSEYYLLARNRDHTWWASLLYSSAMSFFWESFTEGVFEQWSWQDLFITPIGGAVLGELRFRAVQALLNPANGRPRTRAARALVIILDPIGAIADPNRRRIGGR